MWGKLCIHSLVLVLCSGLFQAYWRWIIKGRWTEFDFDSQWWTMHWWKQRAEFSSEFSNKFLREQNLENSQQICCYQGKGASVIWWNYLLSWDDWKTPTQLSLHVYKDRKSDSWICLRRVTWRILTRYILKCVSIQRLDSERRNQRSWKVMKREY